MGEAIQVWNRRREPEVHGRQKYRMECDEKIVVGIRPRAIELIRNFSGRYCHEEFRFLFLAPMYKHRSCGSRYGRVEESPMKRILFVHWRDRFEDRSLRNINDSIMNRGQTRLIISTTLENCGKPNFIDYSARDHEYNVKFSLYETRSRRENNQNATIHIVVVLSNPCSLSPFTIEVDDIFVRSILARSTFFFSFFFFAQ